MKPCVVRRAGFFRRPVPGTFLIICCRRVLFVRRKPATLAVRAFYTQLTHSAPSVAFADPPSTSLACSESNCHTPPVLAVGEHRGRRWTLRRPIPCALAVLWPAAGNCRGRWWRWTQREAFPWRGADNFCLLHHLHRLLWVTPAAGTRRVGGGPTTGTGSRGLLRWLSGPPLRVQQEKGASRRLTCRVRSIMQSYADKYRQGFQSLIRQSLKGL